MASRQEEKEKRRQERLAAEQEAAKKAATKRRLMIVVGGVLALAAVAVVVVVVVLAAGGSGDDEKKTQSAATAAKIPAQQIADLDEAAKAAGCTVKSFPSEGREHSPNPQDWKYNTNPPTSGTHNPEWAEDGVYESGDEPASGFTTHALEHGRINVQYGANVTPAQAAQLEALVAENQGYHMLLFRNQTEMPDAVAATAWTHSVTCKTFNPKIFDALRAFRDRYVDQGPETVP